MLANEVRAFDITNDEGSVRHGIVIELKVSKENQWAALSMGGERWDIVSFHPTPNDAIKAVMDNEDEHLKD